VHGQQGLDGVSTVIALSSQEVQQGVTPQVGGVHVPAIDGVKHGQVLGDHHFVGERCELKGSGILVSMV
jgi:hypothetical protein